jgi:hypothetical protein
MMLQYKKLLIAAAAVQLYQERRIIYQELALSYFAIFSLAVITVIAQTKCSE